MKGVNKVILIGNLGDDPKTSFTKQCKTCQKEIQRSKKLSQAQWENKKYCSKKCLRKEIYDESQIVSMYRSKLSSPEIAEALKISPMQVRRILHRNNVKLRSLSEGKVLSHSKESVRRSISLKKRGVPLAESAKEILRSRIGEKNHNWKNGLTMSSSGYLSFTKSKANGDNAGRCLHEVIAEWVYSRKIAKSEHVHHIDGNKLNNNPENLCILSASEHAKLHNLGEKKWLKTI